MTYAIVITKADRGIGRVAFQCILDVEPRSAPGANDSRGGRTTLQTWTELYTSF